jgi:glutathione S-transferase
VIAWTGRASAPVAIYEDEAPIDRWDEILALTERLAPESSLLPAAADERARMLELARDICGEGGLGWSRRLLVVHDSLQSEGRIGFAPPLARYLADKYGYAPERVAAARARTIGVLRALDGQLQRQRAAGSDYLIGDRLTALDLYAAAALGGLVPLPQDIRSIIPALRPVFERLDPDIAAAISPALLAHRARIAPYLPHR